MLLRSFQKRMRTIDTFAPLMIHTEREDTTGICLPLLSIGKEGTGNRDKK